MATADGRLVTDTAKSCFMIWTDATHAFAKQTSVVKPVMRVYDGNAMILTDEGLAFYYIGDIRSEERRVGKEC